MSDFKAKMHKVRFPHSAPPVFLAVFKGPTSKGKDGKEGGEEERGRERKMEGKRRGREGREGKGGKGSG